MQLSFKEMMRLEAHGPDTFVGTGPTYPWGGLYGGQVVAQALIAAAKTVKPAYLPHSLHANFLRMGDAEEPVRYEVERLRDGRSFFARQVVARQSTGAILNMSSVFRLATTTMDVQLAVAPKVPGPGEAKDASWSRLFELRQVGCRELPLPGKAGDDQRCACSWLKISEPLEEGATTHAAALAYTSDSGPARLVAAVHEEACNPASPWRPLSLDHAIWFHRQFRADEWLLLQAFTGSVRDSSGLATGRIFSQDGALVASIAQDVLLRRPHNG